MERNSILDEDDRETNPLIQNPAPPPPPPLPKARPPPAAVPPGAPTPARTQQIRQRQQATPRPNPLIPRKIAASSAPPPLPPPDGPPPPPPPAVCSADWVLRIKHRGRGILRIHVPEGMTAYLLSKCIIQATDFNDDSVVGLFGYKTGIFFSLEHLLSCNETSSSDYVKELHDQIYSLYVPQPAPPSPWWDDWRIIGGGIVLLLSILYLQLPNVLHLISAIPMGVDNLALQTAYYIPLFYHSLVTQPLKDIYRYGPSFFGGWEGANLPTICARLTYGTEDFWQRNYQDCEKLYQAKESAYLFVGRPLIFLIILMFFIWMARQWMWYEALKVRDNRYHDRDMIQTYQAIQTLFQQMNRMVRANNPQHRGHRQIDYRDN